MLARSSVIAALFLLAGCERLIDLRFRACGNGLVEPELGENCDNAVDDTLGRDLACGPPGVPSQACQYVCGAPTTACPEGWVCGDDDVCFHATSDFVPTFASPLGSDVFFVDSGDFNGDGERDLLWSTGGVARIEYNRDGFFTSGIDIPAPHNFDPAVADLNDDGLSDVTIGFGGPIVLIGQPDGQLLPAAIADNFDEFWGLEGTPRAGGRGMAWRTDRFDRFLLVLRTEGGVCISGACIFEPLPEAAGDVPRIFELASGASSSTVAVVFEGTRALLLVTLTTQSTNVRRITLPRPALGRAAAFDGDLIVQIEPVDDSAHLDAVARVDGDTLDVSLDPTFDLLVPDVDDCLPVGPQPVFPLAVGDFNDDGRSGVVTPVGVFERFGLAWIATDGLFDDLDCNSAGFTHDLNRDGRLDLVTIASRANRLEVRMGIGDGDFVTTPIALRSRPAEVVFGDFDGDLADDDIAFVEPGLAVEQLTVLYSDTPLFGVRRFPVAGRVESMSPLNIPNGNALMSLVVAAEGTTPRGAVVLDGNSYQLMVSRLQPAATEGTNLGYVGTPKFDGVGATILAAWDAERGVYQWTREGGERLVRRDVQLEGTACPSREIQPCLSLINGPLERDSAKEALVMVVRDKCSIGPEPRIITARRSGVGQDLECTDVPIEPLALDDVARIRTADLDGVGPLELVLLLPPGELRIFWDFSESGPVTTMPFDAQDFVVLNTDDDPANEVLAVSHGEARIYEVSGRTLEPSRTLALSDPPSPTSAARAVADDFTNDGLVDVLIAHGKRYTLYRSVGSREAM